MESTHFKQDLTGKVKVIADDLGLDPAINEGIFFAFRNGLIDGASLMPNGKAFEDAVSKVKNLINPKIGIHFVLVEEDSLILKTFSKNHKTFFIKYIFGLISLKNIKKELDAQLNKCIQAGIKPTFINSHQHLHLLPGIMNIIIGLAKEHSIPYIRIVNEPLISKGGLVRKAQLIFLNLLSWMAKNKISKTGLMCNDFFVGFMNAGNLGPGDLILAKKLQNKYPDKIIELGCHPGFENLELVDKYHHWRYHWQKEINVLENNK